MFPCKKISIAGLVTVLGIIRSAGDNFIGSVIGIGIILVFMTILITNSFLVWVEIK